MTGALVAAACGVVNSPGVIQTISNAFDIGADASVILVNDGSEATSGAAAHNWILPATAAIAAQWEVRATVTAGSLSAGTTGTWLALSSSRSWTVATPIGSATITLEFRDAQQTIRKTVTGITLTAT